MKALNLTMTAFMFAIFASMVAVASTYPADARFMPFVIGIPAIALCAMQFVLDWRRLGRRSDTLDHNELAEAEERIRKMTGRDISFDVAHDNSMPHEEFLPIAEARRREKILWAAVLGLLAGVILFGFLVMVPAFIILFLRNLADYSWTRAILSGVGGSAIILGVFEFVLRNELFRGLITNFVIERLGG